MREVALKPLLEERCQPKADGVVTEFGANSNSREQTSSQEKNWIATASAKPRNDGSVKQGLFQRTEDTSGSVALSACLQATSPQGEALERIDTIRGRTHTKGSKSFFRTPWLPESELTLPINGLDLDTVYENIVRFIAGDELISKEGREESLQESIQRAELRQKLTKQIERLQSKINKEKSFARQVELNTQLKALKHQLEELK